MLVDHSAPNTRPAGHRVVRRSPYRTTGKPRRLHGRDDEAAGRPRRVRRRVGAPTPPAASCRAPPRRSPRPGDDSAQCQPGHAGRPRPGAVEPGERPLGAVPRRSQHGRAYQPVPADRRGRVASSSQVLLLALSASTVEEPVADGRAHADHRSLPDQFPATRAVAYHRPGPGAHQGQGPARTRTDAGPASRAARPLLPLAGTALRRRP